MDAVMDWRERTFVGVDGSVWRLRMDIENEGVMLGALTE